MKNLKWFVRNDVRDKACDGVYAQTFYAVRYHIRYKVSDQLLMRLDVGVSELLRERLLINAQS